MGLLVGLITVSVALKLAQLPACGWYRRLAGDTWMPGAAGGAEVFCAAGAFEVGVPAEGVAEARVVGVASAVGVGVGEADEADEADGLADGVAPVPDADALLTVVAESLLAGWVRPVNDERAPVE